MCAWIHAEMACCLIKRLRREDGFMMLGLTCTPRYSNRVNRGIRVCTNIFQQCNMSWVPGPLGAVNCAARISQCTTYACQVAGQLHLSDHIHSRMATARQACIQSAGDGKLVFLTRAPDEATCALAARLIARLLERTSPTVPCQTSVSNSSTSLYLGARCANLSTGVQI